MNSANPSLTLPNELPADFWYRAAVKLIERISDPDRRADLRMTFEERAAICEYDGQLTRSEAERMGFHELRKLIGSDTTAEG